MQQGSAASTATTLGRGQEFSDSALRDVVALSTLPAIWTGAEPVRIAESLAASLFRMLDPQFVYVSFLFGPSPPVAVAQTGRYATDQSLAEQIGPTLLEWSRAHDPDDLVPLDLPGHPAVRAATRQIGLNAEFGVVAAAFAPDRQLGPTELLLLNVAATQAAVAVQNADLLRSLKASEHRANQAAEELARHLDELTLREHRLAEQSRLLDLSSDGIFVRDAGSRILFWNRGAEKLYGFPAEEALNRNSHDLLNTQFPLPLPLIEEQLMREGHWSGELLHTKRDGQRILTFSRWEADIGGDGAIRRILESNTDITERKHQEQELRDREAQFRNLAEALPTLCWMAYADGHIFWYNLRWYEYTGTTLEQMEGWRWQTVHDPEVLPAVMERWTAALRTGENFEMVFPLRRADGSFRPFLTRVVPIRDESGRIVRWFGTNTDIAGQKEIERELRNANADLEQFAYSASHDLQEPLRTVKIFSQLLEAKAKEKLDARCLEYLDVVISGATRMDALLRDLLNYARTTRLEKPAEPTDSNQAIQAALTTLKGAVAETGAIVDFEPLPDLHVHPIQLEQLFQNLIGNAIKYRRPDVTPAVRITAKRLNAQWLFSVADNGIGIETQYQERIFGIFKRLHTGESHPGTGIGLALCQRIVERHNGRIWVESKPGEGSTFYFSLPE